MSWNLLLWLIFALAYLAWIWRDRTSDNSIGVTFCVLGSVGIFIYLASAIVSTLPSHAPLRTITGIAWNRSSGFFDKSHSELILNEEGTGRRILFTTAIDGPWEDQPIRVTYVDDGRSMPSVIRIEILDAKQFPWWHAQKGHVGWVGAAKARRHVPLAVDAIGFMFILLGALAPAKRRPETPELAESESANP